MLNSKKSQNIRRLALDGKSEREIALSLKCSRNTVSRYLKDGTRGYIKPPEKRSYQKHKLAFGNKDELHKLYKQANGNSRVILRRILTDPEKYGLPVGFEVSERSVRRYYSAYFPELAGHEGEKPEAPFHVAPGEQLQIDFVVGKFQFAGKDAPETVYIFEAVYAWSRKSYIRVCTDMGQCSWLLSIADCMEKNGVPMSILCDNDK